MDVAWRLNEEHCFPDWASILTATQLSGRGQFGRTWNSPLDNVYGTVRIPRPGPAWSDLLPLLLADTVRSVLENLGVTATIKWPNDLIVSEKKVGGILLETRSEIVMAGLGLNLSSAPRPHELRHPLGGLPSRARPDGDRCGQNSPFTAGAQELILLGENPRAYLDIDRIIALAKKQGIAAVHPVWGFALEDSGFPE